MRRQLHTKLLATYAKHMVCPISSTSNLSAEELSNLGESSFSSYKYRMESSYYTGESTASEASLLKLLSQALKGHDQTKRPLLLLSDGKDSMGIALAYSELGVEVDTLTLLREEDHELKEYINKVCKTLGHQAHFVTVNEILREFCLNDFLSACKSMENLVLDQGLLFFIFGVKSFFRKNGLDPSKYILIDGLGNDETFGYLPSKNQLLSLNFSSTRIWKIRPSFINSLKWYIRSPAESHGDLSALACFFPIKRSYEINNFFKGIRSIGSPFEIIDFRSFCRGAFHDHQCMMGKSKTTAGYLGTTVFFPWLDESLAEYVFNLPKESKFDFSTMTNKVLLRNLLKSRLGWQQSKRGVDLYFDIESNIFCEKIASQIVPQRILDRIERSFLVSSNVKKRAYLELLNLYGYCLSLGMSQDEVEEILL